MAARQTIAYVTWNGSSSSANVAHAYQNGLRRQKLTTARQRLIIQLLEQG